MKTLNVQEFLNMVEAGESIRLTETQKVELTRKHAEQSVDGLLNYGTCAVLANEFNFFWKTVRKLAA